ncbi:hypothetical protein D3C86_1660300 [compost metagenome]
MQLVEAEGIGIVPRQVHLAQLGFEDQAVERCAHLMGHDGHEIIAHAHGMLELLLGALQLLEQGFLLATAAFQGLDLHINGLALAIQLDEHVDLAAHRMQVQRLVQDVHGTAFIALERIVHITAGGADENDRDVLGHFRAAHQFGQLEAVHAGHLHVENGHGEFMLQQQ